MGIAPRNISKGKPVNERILLASEEEKNLQQLIHKFLTAQQIQPVFLALLFHAVFLALRFRAYFLALFFHVNFSSLIFRVYFSAFIFLCACFLSPKKHLFSNYKLTLFLD
jgi:hypothetical protein